MRPHASSGLYVNFLGDEGEEPIRAAYRANYERLAAIKAVNDGAATFSNAFELQQWLTSDAVKALSAQPDWPTAETAAMWKAFVESFAPQTASTWCGPSVWSFRGGAACRQEPRTRTSLSAAKTTPSAHVKPAMSVIARA